MDKPEGQVQRLPFAIGSPPLCHTLKPTEQPRRTALRYRLNNIAIAASDGLPRLLTSPLINTCASTSTLAKQAPDSAPQKSALATVIRLQQ